MPVDRRLFWKVVFDDDPDALALNDPEFRTGILSVIEPRLERFVGRNFDLADRRFEVELSIEPVYDGFGVRPRVIIVRSLV